MKILYKILAIPAFFFSTQILASTILVLGDIQETTEFNNRQSISVWNNQILGTQEISQRLHEAIELAHPTHILQMGDFVDWNNGATLEVSFSDGSVRRYAQPHEEWSPILGLFPNPRLIFPTVGNHERYGNFTLSATALADNDTLQIDDIQSFVALSNQQVYEQELRHFPHLQSDATFHGRSGTYFVEFPDFCMMSIDGSNLGASSGTYQFIEAKLAQCGSSVVIPKMQKPIIVTEHYPVFSGEENINDQDPNVLALNQLFNRYHVALVLNGHEHYYLRYFEQGLIDAGYSNQLPVSAKYATFGNFANPYPGTFQRLPLSGNGLKFRYFQGTHFGVIDVNNGMLKMSVFGYLPNQSAWHEIDTFSIAR